MTPPTWPFQFDVMIKMPAIFYSPMVSKSDCKKIQLYRAPPAILCMVTKRLANHGHDILLADEFRDGYGKSVALNFEATASRTPFDIASYL
jgi:hypothetical protein